MHLSGASCPRHVRARCLPLHGACPTGNTVYDNADAGLALMESFRADVYDNTFKDNKYGIRLSVGCADNVFVDNDIIGSSK